LPGGSERISHPSDLLRHVILTSGRFCRNPVRGASRPRGRQPAP